MFQGEYICRDRDSEIFKFTFDFEIDPVFVNSHVTNADSSNLFDKEIVSFVDFFLYQL